MEKVGRIGRKNNHTLYLVGVDPLKETHYSQLGDPEPGSDYVHFPDTDDFDLDGFEQLTVERIRTVFDTKGYARREWYLHAHARNEALEVNAYADAAHLSFNWNHTRKLEQLYGPRQTKVDGAAVARMFTE